jgi:prevent-host-death family protein
VVIAHTWQLEEAENKLSQVVENALNDGPQIITRRGVEVAVVLSYPEYQKILASRQNLSDFFRGSPLAGVDLDLTRDTSDAMDDIQL